MTQPTKPRAHKPVPDPGLSHGDVMDLVTGGAAAWANKRHAAKAGGRKPAARKSPASATRREVSIHKDLHLRLQAEAKRRKLTVPELLEQLLKAPAKR
jgi:hypothetical protein